MTAKRSKSLSGSLAFSADLATSLMFSLTSISAALIATILNFTYLNLAVFMMYLSVIPAVAFILIRRAHFGVLAAIGFHLLTTGVFAGAIYLYMKAIRFRQPTIITVYVSIVVIVNMLRSLIRYFRSWKSRLTYDSFICYLGAHILLYFAGSNVKLISNSIMCNAVLVTFLFFAARQVSSFNKDYDHYLNSSTQPVREIKKQNRFTVLVIWLGICLALIALIAIPIDKVTNVVAGALAWIVAQIMRIFILFSRKADERSSGIDADSIIGGGDLEGAKSNEFLAALGEILSILIILTVVIIFLVIGIRAARRLLKQLRAKKVVETERKTNEMNVVDIIEDIPASKKSAVQHDFGVGYEKQIRKKYHKTVSKAIKNGATIRRSASPRQIEAILKEKGDQSISELTSLYESVRYNK